jgi:hypothetical protein
MSCGTCCCEIHTCHAELIHAAAEIQHAKIEFVAADWRGKNYLDILRVGTPGANEIGPHYLPLSRLYSVTVHQYMPVDMTKVVEVGVRVDRTNGTIRMWKTSRVPAFSGRVEVR